MSTSKALVKISPSYTNYLEELLKLYEERKKNQAHSIAQMHRLRAQRVFRRTKLQVRPLR